MEFMITLFFLLMIMVILYFLFEINIKKIKEIGKNEKLDKIAKQFPENKEIAKAILKKLKNEEVEIVENKDSQSSFYFVGTNRISIANIADSYTRVQTIAHECLHSIQSKRLLWFNYLFSNFVIIVYFIFIGLTIFQKIDSFLSLFLLILLFFVQYMVRSFLEIDAMTKAKYVTEEYMKENNFVTKEQREELIQKYEELNKLGIGTVCYELFSKGMIKIIFYILFCMVF